MSSLFGPLNYNAECQEFIDYVELEPYLESMLDTMALLNLSVEEVMKEYHVSARLQLMCKELLEARKNWTHEMFGRR